jgi:hypothetical protein
MHLPGKGCEKDERERERQVFKKILTVHPMHLNLCALDLSLRIKLGGLRRES